MTTDIFDKIETNLMMVLTKEPDRKFNQYELYSELLKKMQINDPIEKENLKYRFFIVLKRLSVTYDKDVKVINEDGILKAAFISDIENNIFEEESTEYINDEKIETPSDISLVRFIIDENIEEYITKKDFEGNSILHTLVLYNDFERFKKIYTRENLSIFDLNNKNQTPIDLINDFKFSNLLITDLLKNNIKNKNEYKILDKEISRVYLQIKLVRDFTVFIFVIMTIKILLF